MLSLAPHSRIWLCTTPADMRKSFDGLCGLVRSWLLADPLSGEIFVFRNKLGDRVKILTWLPGGLCIWYQRLEAGTFRFPEPGVDGRHCKVTSTELHMLLDGIELENVKRRKRYQQSPPPSA